MSWRGGLSGRWAGCEANWYGVVSPWKTLCDLGHCGPGGDYWMNVLTEKQVATRLQVSTRTLQRWRRDGLIPFYLLPGGQVRYNEETVSNWLTRGCPVPRTSP